jgi:alpha-L-fucosidase 2
LKARVGDAEGAAKNLETFVRAFVLRNGFHANGEQTAGGLSNFTYRPFTLEGNMLVAAAVHEMLLQSWSPRPGTGDWGAVRLFPAVPARWRDVSFEDLRAEGGHRVSAQRAGGVTTWFRIVAGRSGLLKIRDNFGGRALQWSRAGVHKIGDDYHITLKAGEAVEARLP